MSFGVLGSAQLLVVPHAIRVNLSNIKLKTHFLTTDLEDLTDLFIKNFSYVQVNCGVDLEVDLQPT